MLPEQIEAVETHLRQLALRLPEMPVEAVLIMRLVVLLAHDINQMLEHLTRPSGLAEGEFRVLTALFVEPSGGAHPTDLCSRATQSPANMSRISDELVERGLITRVPSDLDRRKTVLQITAAGEELVLGLLPAMFVRLRAAGGQHTPAEKKVLITELKKLAASLDSLKHSALQELPP